MHPNEVAHRAILAAFAAGDLATSSGYYADDAVFHINGRNALSGDHVGFDGFLSAFGRLMAVVSDYRQEVVDVGASDARSFAVLRVSMTMGDRDVAFSFVTVLTWRDGKVVDERLVAEDPYVFDELLPVTP